MDLTKIIVNLRCVVAQLDDMIHVLERTAASKSKRIGRTRLRTRRQAPRFPKPQEPSLPRDALKRSG